MIAADIAGQRLVHAAPIRQRHGALRPHPRLLRLQGQGAVEMRERALALLHRHQGAAEVQLQFGHLVVQARGTLEGGQRQRMLAQRTVGHTDLMVRLEELAAQTHDTVHLAALDEDEGIIYLDKIGGQRPIEVSTRIGGRKPVCCTSVGKALILDDGRAAWKKRYQQEFEKGLAGRLTEDEWLAAMANYAAKGYSFDMDENNDGIRCVGAPIRDASGDIVASISVTSTDTYTDAERMKELIPLVQAVAKKISVQLGGAG